MKPGQVVGRWQRRRGGPVGWQARAVCCLAIAGLLAVLGMAAPAQAQVYRCGNAYSHAPCAGGKEVDVSPPMHWSQSDDGTQALYLCEAFGGGQFWSTRHCRLQDALVERIERVPRDLPFDQQVALARQRMAPPPGAAPALNSPAPAQPAPGADVAGRCRALDDRVQQLDAMARAGGHARYMDWIAAQRKSARDRQFRLRC